MLSIDGSYGEGGGQIVRTAVAFSVLTKTPIEISNIRAKRPVPGLRPQHYAAVSCVQALCNAEVSGLSVGSTSLQFSPGEVRPGSYTFDIGTAGSMVLVFQTCMLASLKAKGPVTLQLTGGTDILWAPSWDYFTHVFLPLVASMGARCEATLRRRGYYPKGGGEAELCVLPSDNLRPFTVADVQQYSKIEGIVHSAGLPEHIAQRMKHAVLKEAVAEGFKADVATESVDSPSIGTGITLWASSGRTVLGSAVLGERRLPAEQVGARAWSALLADIRAGASLDPHAVDQLLPYMVASGGRSVCRVRACSTHTTTGMWVLAQFAPRRFDMRGEGEAVTLTVEEATI